MAEPEKQKEQNQPKPESPKPEWPPGFQQKDASEKIIRRDMEGRRGKSKEE